LDTLKPFGGQESPGQLPMVFKKMKKYQNRIIRAMLYFKYLCFKKEHFSNMQLYGNLFLIFFKNNVKSLDVRSFVKWKPKSGICPAALTPML